jgi:hypothetical protein
MDVNKIEQVPISEPTVNKTENGEGTLINVRFLCLETKSDDKIQNGTERTDKPAKDKIDFEIINEEYKKHIVKEDKDDEDDDDSEKEDNEEKIDEDKKDKKKKKKKNKKKKRKDSDDEGKKDPNAPKKVQHATIDNPNIPEGLRQKYSEYEKNPLCIAVGNIPLNSSIIELKGYFITLISSLRPDMCKIF